MYIAEMEYDESGHEIHTAYSDGYKVWREYNNGKLIHCKDSTGYEIWYEYGDNRNLIRSEDSNGHIRFYKQDNKLKSLLKKFINKFKR